MRIHDAYAVTCWQCHGEREMPAAPVDAGRRAECGRCGAVLAITPMTGQSRLIGAISYSND